MVKSLLEYYKFELLKKVYGAKAYSLFVKMASKKLEHIFVQLFDKTRCDFALDLGCGKGYALPTLAKQSHHVVGIDIDCESLERAKSAAHKTVSLIAADALRPPFREGVFDVIIVNHVLEHLINVEVALKNINVLLKKNGYVYVAVPWMSELVSVSFGPKIPLQIMRTLIHKALDDTYYGRRSLLTKILLRTEGREHEVRLRRYIPSKYVAKTLKKTINLQDYIKRHLRRELNDPHHKHWFSRKEWVLMVKTSGLEVRFCEGLFNVELIAKK